MFAMSMYVAVLRCMQQSVYYQLRVWPYAVCRSLYCYNAVGTATSTSTITTANAATNTAMFTSTHAKTDANALANTQYKDDVADAGEYDNDGHNCCCYYHYEFLSPCGKYSNECGDFHSVCTPGVLPMVYLLCM